MSKIIPYSRVSDADWQVWQNDDGTLARDELMKVLLMDIRAELQRLNRLLQCANFIAIPDVLRDIRKNTAKRRVRRRK